MITAIAFMMFPDVLGFFLILWWSMKSKNTAKCPERAWFFGFFKTLDRKFFRKKLFFFEIFFRGFWYSVKVRIEAYYTCERFFVAIVVYLEVILSFAFQMLNLRDTKKLWEAFLRIFRLGDFYKLAHRRLNMWTFGLQKFSFTPWGVAVDSVWYERKPDGDDSFNFLMLSVTLP